MCPPWSSCGMVLGPGPGGEDWLDLGLCLEGKADRIRQLPRCVVERHQRGHQGYFLDYEKDGVVIYSWEKLGRFERKEQVWWSGEGDMHMETLPVNLRFQAETQT